MILFRVLAVIPVKVYENKLDVKEAIAMIPKKAWYYVVPRPAYSFGGLFTLI